MLHPASSAAVTSRSHLADPIRTPALLRGCNLWQLLSSRTGSGSIPAEGKLARSVRLEQILAKPSVGPTAQADGPSKPWTPPGSRNATSQIINAFRFKTACKPCRSTTYRLFEDADKKTLSDSSQIRTHGKDRSRAFLMARCLCQTASTVKLDMHGRQGLASALHDHNGAAVDQNKQDS